MLFGFVGNFFFNILFPIVFIPLLTQAFINSCFRALWMYSWKDYHLTLELDFYENSKEGEKTVRRIHKQMLMHSPSYRMWKLNFKAVSRFTFIRFSFFLRWLDMDIHMHFCWPEFLISWRELTFDIGPLILIIFKFEIRTWSQVTEYAWNQHNVCHDCNIRRVCVCVCMTGNRRARAYIIINN